MDAIFGIRHKMNIRGWMSEHELAWLSEQTAYTVIEIGCAYGRSTFALADRAKRLYAVDTWQGSPAELKTNHKDYAELDGDFAMVAFCANLGVYIRRGTVVPLRMHSRNAAQVLTDWGVFADLIFIDGDHDYEAVKEDIRLYQPLLREGGILCGHDYGDSNWPGVRKAVDELIPNVKIAPMTRIWIA
jgi:SAM-dependent methyltransferase